MKTIRTSNGRTIEFAYKPSSAESAALMSQGQSQERAGSLQFYTVTPDGLDVEDSVAAYAVHTHHPLIVEEYISSPVEVAASVIDPRVTDGDTTATETVDVEVTGEGKTPSPPDPPDDPPAPTPDDPRVPCPSCPEVFTGKTVSGAKSRLRAHTSKDHN